MADAKTWAERIAEWKASGLSAAKFTAGREFSAHQLWNWSSRFRQEAAAKTTSARVAPRAVGVRIARVVRVQGRTRVVASTGAPLSVELCGMRIVVPPGFDRATFAAVLDDIETRRARVGGR